MAKPTPTEEAWMSLRKLVKDSALSKEEREIALKQLGKDIRTNQSKKKNAVTVHQCLRSHFTGLEKAPEGDDAVLQEIRKFKGNGKELNLGFLLTKGFGDFTVLHTLFEQVQEDQEAEADDAAKPFSFNKIKPLVRLLLKIDPSLPIICNLDRHTLLSFVIDSPVGKSIKEDIIHCFCRDAHGADSAIQSLTIMTRTSDEGEVSRHMIHKAIEGGVRIDFDLIKKANHQQSESMKSSSNKTQTPFLRAKNSDGKTCLHLALTAPFTKTKLEWAKSLAVYQPDLLQQFSTVPSTGAKDMTALQHFSLERKKPKNSKNKTDESPRSSDNGKQAKYSEKDKLDQTNSDSVCSEDELNRLEDCLKRVCLENFDDGTVKRIMYMKDDKYETYLGFSGEDQISGKSLNKLKQHYKLDTILRCVYLPKLKVYWDDDDSAPSRAEASKWNCPGRKDYFMIFDWLKRTARVQKVLEIVVDDSDPVHELPHSDEAIYNCLKDLKIEKWDWKRPDISSGLIHHVAGEHIRELHLYCSGRDAVLRGWADVNGLPMLKNLGSVEYEIHQGLESSGFLRTYMENFEDTLKRNFKERNGKDLKVTCNNVITSKRGGGEEGEMATLLKDEGQDGFDEQDWLRCMDEFAFIMEDLCDKEGEVKVALLDDGVRSNYAGLDDNIATGMTCATVKASDQRFKQNHNYNISEFGHGTAMAYFIRRICPRVRLYIARLDGRDNARGVSFTVDSAVQAIDWAIEEQVHIISMSWAIDPAASGKDEKWLQPLKQAITRANDEHNILLFCANPDKGVGSVNETYPTKAGSVFCVGAAQKDGNRWDRIGKDDDSCHYFLPGVDVGIPNTTGESGMGTQPPPPKWDKHSGSSISCALAVGLAAMILHAAKACNVRDDEWNWLQSRAGMEKAFASIPLTHDKWVPVRGVFGLGDLKKGSRTDREKALKTKVVDRFLRDMPRS